MCTSFRPYIGIPFVDCGRDLHGMDCFGIIKHFYQKEFGLHLPDVIGIYTSAHKPEEVKEAVIAYEHIEGIVEVQPPYKDFDVIVFTLCGVDSHVGMITNAKRREMLHLFRGGESVIERYDYPKWAKRISRVFRHAANC